jgi:hypothetical protein
MKRDITIIQIICSILLLAGLMLGAGVACKEDGIGSSWQPSADQCTEFTWTTEKRGNLSLVCRVLWCVAATNTNAAVGGPAVLYCDPIYKNREHYYHGDDVTDEQLDDAGVRRRIPPPPGLGGL